MFYHLVFLNRKNSDGQGIILQLNLHIGRHMYIEQKLQNISYPEIFANGCQTTINQSISYSNSSSLQLCWCIMLPSIHHLQVLLTIS